jgi:hypothetical protein
MVALAKDKASLIFWQMIAAVRPSKGLGWSNFFLITTWPSLNLLMYEGGKPFGRPGFGALSAFSE